MSGVQIYSNPPRRCGIRACPANVTPSHPVTQDVLVIAGGTGGRGFNHLLRGDNDGLIAVAETRMPGYETAFQMVRSVHKNLPVQPATIAACLSFLAAETQTSRSVQLNFLGGSRIARIQD